MVSPADLAPRSSGNLNLMYMVVRLSWVTKGLLMLNVGNLICAIITSMESHCYNSYCDHFVRLLTGLHILSSPKVVRTFQSHQIRKKQTKELTSPPSLQDSVHNRFGNDGRISLETVARIPEHQLQ